jgi:chorismate mutase / prephenate dehydratase
MSKTMSDSPTTTENTTSLELQAVRTQIDELDAHIHALVNQRAALAKEVARAKYALEANPNFYRPEREAEVLARALQRNQSGLLPDAFINRLFREIMSACLALQKPVTVAYLGPEGTYSQAAVLKHFGHAVVAVAVSALDEVFREVEADSVHYGVVPVENSTEGGVNQSLDLFVASPLKICGEVELPIHHHLLSKNSEINTIKRIYSHPQSLAQCRVWLDTHAPNIERIAVASNAEAARRATVEDNSGAIAGQMAAELYQLTIVARRIEDYLHNTTRFAVLGKQNVPTTGRDKTSLLLSAANRPGSLYHLLEPLANHGLSMTRIESRPSRQAAWEYVFYVDIEGHIEHPTMAAALAHIQAHCSLFKHLGSYPKALL